MLAPSKGSPRQKDYVVVGGQKVYLNFIHAKRQNHSNFPIPHSLANPFVKESSLVGAVRSAPASTAAAKRSPSRSRHRAEDDAAAAEPPPVILELRNQTIEHELGRRGDDDADDCDFSIEEFTPPAAAAKKRKAAEAAAAASAIKRELEAVEMKRAAAAEQDKRAEREKRREIEKEKIARQKAKGKEKAPESSEEDENDDEGGSEGEEEEEETDSPRSKRRRTVEPARRQLPDKTLRTKSAPQPSSVTSNHRTSPTSPRGIPSPLKSPFTVPTSPFAAASTRLDKRATPAKSPRTSASSSGTSASLALPSAAAAISNSTGPASTSTSTSTTTTFSTTSACIPSSLDPMSSPSDEFEVTSSFLATIDVLEKSVTSRWSEEKEDLGELRTDRSKTDEPPSEGVQSAARGTHERRPNGDGDDCDDEEQLETKSARAALPAVRGRTKATVSGGRADREEVMDSQWIDSPFCMSTQAARAFAAAAPLVSRPKRWANQAAATDDGAGASTWDESPASSWSPASPSSSPLQSGFSLLPPAL